MAIVGQRPDFHFSCKQKEWRRKGVVKTAGQAKTVLCWVARFSGWALAMKLIGGSREIRNDQNGSNQRECGSRGLVSQNGCFGEF